MELLFIKAKPSNWNGDFFIGVLGDQTIIRMRIRDGKVLEQQDLLPYHNERIRFRQMDLYMQLQIPLMVKLFV